MGDELENLLSTETIGAIEELKEHIGNLYPQAEIAFEETMQYFGEDMVEKGFDAGAEAGVDKGFDAGYEAGVSAGYEVGKLVGRFDIIHSVFIDHDIKRLNNSIQEVLDSIERLE